MSAPPPPQPGYGPPPPQHPYPPQAHPPQPHPQQAYPPPQAYPPQQYPGYGGPPMGPLPPRNTRGNTLAIVIGVAVVLFLVIGSAIEVYGSADPAGSSATPESDEAYIGPTYTLEPLPETLLDGTYSLTRDMSETVDQQRPKGTPYADGLEVTAGFYTADSGSGSGTDTGGSQLFYEGLSSADENPFHPEYGLLNGMADDPAIDVAVPRRIFGGEGADELACEVHTKAEASQQITFPVCSWVDPHTQAAVMDNSPATWTTAPEDVDLKAFAAKVAAIRDEVRVETDG